MNKLIAHHLGMGDHIVHCGLVRHIYKRDVRKYDTIFILCYRHNAENVKRMYEGLNKIELLIIDNENEIGSAIDNFVGDKEDFHLDQQGYELYNQIGDDAFFENKKYDKKLRKEFQIKRDLKKELEHFNNYASSHNEYIFVHDDLERGYEIKNLPNLPIVRIPKEVPLFETLTIIERAKECHVISSAFVCLLQSMPSLNSNVTVHTSVRNSYLESYFKNDGLKTL